MLGSGSGIKHPESATLHYSIVYQFVLNILAFFAAVFFLSGSAWIRIQLLTSIRIRIPNANPDPGGLKRDKNEEKKRCQKDR
jgi:hypothetical protein